MSKVNKKEKSGKNKLLQVLFVIVIIAFLVVGYMIYHLLTTQNADTNKEFSEAFEPETLVSLEDFTLQLSDRHYAKLSINVGIVSDDEKQVEEAKVKTPVLRDKIITELMLLHSEDLSATNLEVLKQQLKSAISPLLPDLEVQSIYFDNLLVQ